MDKVYIVNFVINQGGDYTTVESTYHKTLLEGESEYQNCLDSVGEDPSMVELVELDLGTMKGKTLESFEGTYEDIETYEDFEVE
jgi:hypothetical protein